MSKHKQFRSNSDGGAYTLQQLLTCATVSMLGRYIKGGCWVTTENNVTLLSACCRDWALLRRFSIAGVSDVKWSILFISEGVEFQYVSLMQSQLSRKLKSVSSLVNAESWNNSVRNVRSSLLTHSRMTPFLVVSKQQLCGHRLHCKLNIMGYWILFLLPHIGTCSPYFRDPLNARGLRLELENSLKSSHSPQKTRTTRV